MKALRGLGGSARGVRIIAKVVRKRRADVLAGIQALLKEGRVCRKGRRLYLVGVEDAHPQLFGITMSTSFSGGGT